MNHPLTDELIVELIGDRYYDEDDMRTAYDKGCRDTLNKVTDWIIDNLEDPRRLEDSYLVVDGEKDNLFVAINTDSVIDDLHESMRPQQQEDNQ